MLLLSITCLILSLPHFRYIKLSLFYKILLAILSVVSFFLSILEMISHKLSGNSIDRAMLYHLQYGLDGAGFGEFLDLIAIGLIVICLGLGIILYSIFGRSNQPRNYPRKRTKILAILLLLASIILNPATYATIGLLRPHKTSAPLISFFKEPIIKKIPKTLPDIIWIYAESLERTYMNEAIFPGLLPNLKKIESESVSLNNIVQIPATGWTIAGIVSSQCGFPLISTGGGGNSMNAMPVFLPKATCFGDLLKSAGYRSVFFGGAETEFAGKGKFFRSHGYSLVYGKRELEQTLSDKTYQNPWGLQDDTVLDKVVETYEKMKKTGKPFNITALTLDTHSPKGHVSNLCKDKPYKDGNNPILNAAHCSDYLISRLVKKIRNLDHSENTVIVITSDHLAMQNSASELLEGLDRRNMAIINWPAKFEGQVIERRAATVSIGVTILDLLGFEIKEMGLGRSLISSELDLMERYSDIEAMIDGWDSELKKLWDLPEIPEKLDINPKNHTVQFSGYTFSLPLIIDYGRNQKEVNLIFDDPWKPLDKIVKTLSSETRSIWLDNCLRINSTIYGATGDNDEICIWDDKMKKIFRVPNRFDYYLDSSRK